MDRSTRRIGLVLASVLVGGVGVTALATAANNDWRQEWKSLKISPEPGGLKDIPCPATPETRRIVSSSNTVEDPGYHASERIRVLVLDDVANTGTEPITMPERHVTWDEKGSIEARQSSNFPDEMRMTFRHLTGPVKKKDWERSALNQAGNGTSTHPGQVVHPGQGIARYIILWKLTETETRTAKDGDNLRTGTRTRIRRGLSFAAHGYHARSQRVDPCTGNWIPLPDPSEANR